MNPLLNMQETQATLTLAQSLLEYQSYMDRTSKANRSEFDKIIKALGSPARGVKYEEAMKLLVTLIEDYTRHQAQRTLLFTTLTDAVVGLRNANFINALTVAPRKVYSEPISYELAQTTKPSAREPLTEGFINEDGEKEMTDEEQAALMAEFFNTSTE